MFWWIVLGLLGAFALGVIAGVVVGSSAHPYEQIRTTEPLTHVSDLRRTRAPFGVSPQGRPWDDDRD